MEVGARARNTNPIDESSPMMAVLRVMPTQVRNKIELNFYKKALAATQNDITKES